MISSPTEITKEWLADVLHVPIKQITIRENLAFNSAVRHLDVTYPRAEKLPSKLIVKLNRDHDGQNEIQFYRLAEGMKLSMIPPRLGMEYDAQRGVSLLILEDLSDTHVPPVTREQLKALDGVPSNKSMQAIVNCIAEFHAMWWEHPRFETIPDTTELRWWYRDENFHSQHVERRRREWSKFVEMYRSEVPEQWLVFGESMLGKLPHLFESQIKPRIGSKRALTMSQGDCYLTQFLVPRDEAGRAFLIDFQDACVNFPAYDLVYMFATFWTREQRSTHEEALLHRYQQRLNQYGIEYGWEILRDDYRLCLSYMLFDAVWNATSGSAREYWKPKMKCLINACEDWRCLEL